MDTDRRLLLQNYLSNVQVNVTDAEYTQCTRSWRELNYTPSFNKFYFIRKGCGWLQIDGKDYYPEPGQLFLMPAGVLQSFSAVNDDPFLKYWCHFTAVIGERSLFDLIKPPLFIRVEEPFVLENLFRTLTEEMRSKDITAVLRLKAAMLQIISYYIEKAAAEEDILPETATSVRVGAIISYINKHMNEHLTVECLAEQLHLHPNYFMRFFKAHLGTSPMQYINRVRMQKAKELLKQTDMQVTAVAEAAGFKDLFYFSKTFKTYTGFSPSEYRNT